MKVLPDVVKKVAALSALSIPEEKIEKYCSQLSEILDYADQLNKVSTDTVEPLFNINSSSNIFNESKIQTTLTQDQALKNKETQNGYFVTKGVFEDV